SRCSLHSFRLGGDWAVRPPLRSSIVPPTPTRAPAFLKPECVTNQGSAEPSVKKKERGAMAREMKKGWAPHPRFFSFFLLSLCLVSTQKKGKEGREEKRGQGPRRNSRKE